MFVPSKLENGPKFVYNYICVNYALKSFKIRTYSRHNNYISIEDGEKCKSLNRNIILFFVLITYPIDEHVPRQIIRATKVPTNCEMMQPQQKGFIFERIAYHHQGQLCDHHPIQQANSKSYSHFPKFSH